MTVEEVNKLFLMLAHRDDGILMNLLNKYKCDFHINKINLFFHQWRPSETNEEEEHCLLKPNRNIWSYNKATIKSFFNFSNFFILNKKKI